MTQAGLDRLMTTISRTIIVALTLVGAYYVVVGGWALLSLGNVTRRWTQLSGDPDFPADFSQFSMLIGAGAIAWLFLGIGTVRCGVRALMGRHVPLGTWIGLTVIAVVMHVPWLMYRSIATGLMPRSDAALQVRWALWQFAVVALLYISAAFIAWWRPLRRPQSASMSS